MTTLTDRGGGGGVVGMIVLFLIVNAEGTPDGLADQFVLKFNFTLSQCNTTVVANKMCKCKMMCFVVPDCTAVSISTTSEDKFNCCLSYHAEPFKTLTPKNGTITLMHSQRLSGNFFHHNGKDFYVNIEQKLTWTDSRQWCQDRGGDLAQPTGDLIAFMQQVHQLLFPYVGSAALWMGASDIASEEQWFWVSGTQLPNNFPWIGNQPDNAGGHEDCLEIRCSGDVTTCFYNDNRCTFPMYFVCKL